MKRVIILLALVIVTMTCLAVPRMTLVETFTNEGSSPSSVVERDLDRFTGSHNNEFCVIRYHTDWPTSTDPFYLNNTLQNDAAEAFYGVSVLPSVYIDGSSSELNLAAITDAATVSSPVSIELSMDRVNDSVTANITVHEATAGSNFALFFTTVENGIAYAAANGVTEFNQTFRHAFPASSGDPIDLSSTGAQVFGYKLDLTDIDVANNSEIICYIQDRVTKQVVQASRISYFGYSYYAYPRNSYICSIGADSVAAETLYVVNNNDNADDYTITVTNNCRVEWTIGSAFNSTPFTGSTTETVGAHDTAMVIITFNTAATEGNGDVVVEFQSANIGGDLTTCNLIFMVGGNILLVDDDNGYDYETFYIEALQNGWWIPYYWNTSTDGTPGSALMATFDAVVWFTGDEYLNTITSSENAALSMYLSGGGNLFMTGSEIGYDIGTSPFYSNYLRATYLGDEADSSTVIGRTSDPVGDGFSFAITGGDGADNQSYPDYIAATGGSVEGMHYGIEDGPQAASVWYSGAFRVVYFGFGFEGIDNQTDRDAVMSRVLNFLAVPMSTSEEVTIPENWSIGTAPNPFNGACNIDVPEGTIVEIYDSYGKKVHEGSGSFIWNPVNGTSGVYLVKAAKGHKVITEKVLYIK